MPIDADTVGKGFALWLMPEEPAFSLLAREISRLSRLHSSPKFEPHVTLLGGILLPEQEALKKASLLAKHLKPFKIELADIGYLDEYFRCLFVKVVPENSLMQAHRAACEAFGQRDKPDYMPHVSLMYGKFPARTKKRISARLSRLSGLACDIRRLILCRVSGAARDWKPITGFGLSQDFPPR